MTDQPQTTYPVARVYERKSGWGTGWYYKFDGDEIAFGPFPSPLDAGVACHQAILRRAEGQDDEG